MNQEVPKLRPHRAMISMCMSQSSTSNSNSNSNNSGGNGNIYYAYRIAYSDVFEQFVEYADNIKDAASGTILEVIEYGAITIVASGG
jgi:hypothetical protein